MADKLKIAVCAIFWPMAIAQYFVRALNRRSDVELRLVGEFPGSHIPWNGGMVLDPKYATGRDVAVANGTPAAAVENQLKDWAPDLFLNIDAAWHLDGRPRNALNYYVATDAHCIGYDAQRRLSDKFYNMHQAYSQPGDLILPYAYDLDQWHPDHSFDNLEWDVVMCGVVYDGRKLLLDALQRSGLRVRWTTGLIFEEYNQFHEHAFMALNCASRDDLAARYFETKALGLLSLDKLVTDHQRFWTPGEHALVFGEVNEAVDLAHWAIENKSDAIEIARAGQLITERHTYDERVDRIVRQAKLDIGGSRWAQSN